MDTAIGSPRQRAGSNTSNTQAMASPTSDSQPTLGLPSESVKKLDQIVQVSADVAHLLA